jgi:hypothetical protein
MKNKIAREVDEMLRQSASAPRRSHATKQKSLTPQEKRRVIEDIENEGLDYTFESYTNYEEIDDPEFHRRRLAYLRASKALRDYLST